MYIDESYVTSHLPIATEEYRNEVLLHLRLHPQNFQISMLRMNDGEDYVEELEDKSWN